MDTTELLEFDKVSYHYKDGSKQVNILKNADYTFKKGQIYAIVGASGSGKTTSLMLAGGLDVPKEGCIKYKGQDIQKQGLTKYRKNDVSIVFQSYNLISYMNAIQNVVCGMDIAGIKVKNKKEHALNILKELGLSEDECQRDIRHLSGGQQQRIAIARAIGKNVDLILCDEPTGNLDSKTSKEMTKIFIDLAHKYNKCVIVVTHSKSLASQLDQQLHIKEGQFVDL